MRHLPAFTAAMLAIVSLSACSAHGVERDDDGSPGIAASGGGGERHYTVANFDRVALGAAGEVEVRTGQAFGLSVQGDPADLDRLKVTVDGNTLGLGRTSGAYKDAGRIRWTVTMPRIRGADIGGSGAIRIDKAEAEDFTGNIGGSGDLSVAAMKVGKADFNIGGSGTVDVAGTATALGLQIGGSGKLHATPLTAQTASISIVGAGTIEATVKKTADVNIVGSGDVTIAGGAKCSVTKMGGGTVHCG